VAGEALAYLKSMQRATRDLAMSRSSRAATLRIGDESCERPYAVVTTQRRMSVKEWSAAERPRERLMTLGAGALSDAELLAILMRTGTRQHDALAMCRTLLQHFVNETRSDDALHRLAQRDHRELQAIPGIGPAKAVTLAAAFELGRRATASSFDQRIRIGGPRDIASIFIPELRHAQKEQFHVVILNTANQVVRRVLVSEGNLNSSIVHPREVYRHAIVESAAAVIGIHNHPSGNPAPSKEDIAITRQLVEAGRIIGIPLHDHIIIAGEAFVSLAEKGYI
jgi:DNA repair protein RadC